jgi:hypothetical protein
VGFALVGAAVEALLDTGALLEPDPEAETSEMVMSEEPVLP